MSPMRTTYPTHLILTDFVAPLLFGEQYT